MGGIKKVSHLFWEYGQSKREGPKMCQRTLSSSPIVGTVCPEKVPSAQARSNDDLPTSTGARLQINRTMVLEALEIVAEFKPSLASFNPQRVSYLHLQSIERYI